MVVFIVTAQISVNAVAHIRIVIDAQTSVAFYSSAFKIKFIIIITSATHDRHCGHEEHYIYW